MLNTKSKMDEDAALMAARGMQTQKRPAPMVPVSNTAMPRKPRVATRIGPKSMAPIQQQTQMGMSAPPPSMSGYAQQGDTGDMASGMGMNVTGPGTRGSAGTRKSKPISGFAGWTDIFKSDEERIRDEIAGATDGDLPTNDLRDTQEEVIRRLLEGGVRDTADEEALIREDMMRQTGQGQADLMARLGGAGFGTSGVASSLMGDLNSQAAFNASKMVQDVRQGARDDSFRDSQLGLGAGATDRRLDMDEDQYARYLDVLQNIFGDGGEDAPPDSNPVIESIAGAVGAETVTPSLPTSNGKTAKNIENGMDPASAIPTSSPPSDAQETSEPGIWYSPRTRKYYKVQ